MHPEISLKNQNIRKPLFSPSTRSNSQESRAILAQRANLNLSDTAGSGPELCAGWF